VIAHSPCHSTLLARGGALVGLALDAQLHDVVTADGAVVYNDIPSPEGDGVPLFDFEARSLLSFSFGGLGCHRSIFHFNIGHYDQVERRIMKRGRGGLLSGFVSLRVELL